ncbi:Ger(x)C family spore germination protein [Brevibacillus agri]|uniref:Ger(x)C family spore germination protein n=1 Tax=Brevibacillus agri TaxID=51101 RepID=UPI00046FDD85|nr:Ger(x)C family spore germination protein [Brevibacillus agri]MCG5252252.1 Ger(x)C family spore germination protein [Brevibacillus agri]
MNRRLTLACMVVLLCTLVTGCWDQVQIEERGFVVGVAIDAPRSNEAEKRAAKESPGKPRVKQRFLVTHQLVIPGGLIAGNQGGGGGQNTTNEAFLNLSSEGDSLFEVSRELATRTSRAPFYQHLKVLVISEEVARSENGFANAMDFLLRDPDSRRSSKVFISNGPAKSIIEVKPKTEKLPALYINSIGENIDRNARMLPEVRVGDVHEELLNPFSFVIPRVRAEKNEIKMAGSAVFSNRNQMVGFLGEEETEGLNFLTGNINGGLLKAKVKNDLVVLNIQGTKHSIVQDLRDKQHFIFTIQIECEGILAEAYALMDFLSKEETKKLEQAFAKEIERMCRDTIQKVHKEMKADVIKLGSNIRQKDYSLWKQIQHDWEKGQRLYEKSEIHVEAKVYLRNVGSINRSEKVEGR